MTRETFAVVVAFGKDQIEGWPEHTGLLLKTLEKFGVTRDQDGVWHRANGTAEEPDEDGLMGRIAVDFRDRLRRAGDAQMAEADELERYGRQKFGPRPV